jgi:ring-1,2-phenylacetyl-CoA epoxidase subunit PaaE
MATRARFHPLPVRSVERITDDAVALSFDVPDELTEAYAHTAGQHVTIVAPALDDGVRRSYSLCTPAGSGDLTVGVKLLPGGSFSTYVAEKVQPGDELEVLTPVGRFGPRPVADGEAPRSYVGIAAGSGITPILSIVATVLEQQPEARVTLLYVNRTTRSVMFAEELEDLKDRYPARFQLLHLLTREPGRVELLSGRLDGARLGRLLDTLVPPDDVDEWFLCGPHAMVVELRDTLLARGVEPAQVHTELFHADVTPPSTAAGPVGPSATAPPVPAPATTGESGRGAEVTLLLDGRRSTVRIPSDGAPVLEAALAVRSDAPFSCRGGVCGTCRAKLLEGTVSMDHSYALEPDEIARGYVLTCQSHPTSDRVVVDFDA